MEGLHLGEQVELLLLVCGRQRLCMQDVVVGLNMWGGTYQQKHGFDGAGNRLYSSSKCVIQGLDAKADCKVWDGHGAGKTEMGKQSIRTEYVEMKQNEREVDAVREIHRDGHEQVRQNDEIALGFKVVARVE